MIIANVKAGHYLFINENVVVAKVFRNVTFGKSKWPVTTYDVKWMSGRTESFRTLADIGNAYEFDNFPGYNTILDKKNVMPGYNDRHPHYMKVAFSPSSPQ